MALTCRRLSSAQESSRIIGEGQPSTDNIQTANQGTILILTVPDEKIEKIVARIAVPDINWKDKLVFHCSGLLSSSILDPLKKKGAQTASLHPIQSFPTKKTETDVFEKIYFGIEGDSKSLEQSKKIVGDLGGQSIIVERGDKPLYHAACSIASNFLIVLLDTSKFLLSQMGLEPQKALKILLPLVQGTLQNVKDIDADSSLTGPVVRGDKKSIEKHLLALKRFPAIHGSYIKLTAQALEIAKKEKKLHPQEIKKISALLEEQSLPLQDPH